LYSVPWRHIGRTVWVRATPSSVLVYADDVRVATHERRSRGAGRRSTNDSHLPDGRADLRYRSMAWWQERASRLGPSVAKYIDAVANSDDVLSKLRDVQAIVTYLEQYPRHRAQAACERADFFGNYTYRGLKRILVRGLDLAPRASSARASRFPSRPAPQGRKHVP
jgi:hypothetical protein